MFEVTDVFVVPFVSFGNSLQLPLHRRSDQLKCESDNRIEQYFEDVGIENNEGMCCGFIRL